MFSSQIWVSHVTFVTVTKNVTRYICHISGKNVTLSHSNFFCLTCDVVCDILSSKRQILGTAGATKI